MRPAHWKSWRRRSSTPGRYTHRIESRPGAMVPCLACRETGRHVRTPRANGLSRAGPGALNFIGTRLGNRGTRPMMEFRGSSHGRGIEELTDAKTATHDARSLQRSRRGAPGTGPAGDPPPFG